MAASPISIPPENRQPLARAPRGLSGLCFQKEVRLETQGQHRYGRTIATVYCAGISANAEQER
jgi:endonuclease YncB( thermonuclease family)